MWHLSQAICCCTVTPGATTGAAEKSLRNHSANMSSMPRRWSRRKYSSARMKRATKGVAIPMTTRQPMRTRRMTVASSLMLSGSSVYWHSPDPTLSAFSMAGPALGDAYSAHVCGEMDERFSK